MLKRTLLLVVLFACTTADESPIPWSNFVCKLIFRELDGAEIVNERQCYGSYVTMENEAGETGVKVLTHVNCLELSRRPEEVRRQIWLRCGGTAKMLGVDQLSNTTEKYHLLVDGPTGPKFETIKHYSVADVPQALQEEMAKEAAAPIPAKVGKVGKQCIDLLSDEAALYEDEKQMHVNEALVGGAATGMPIVCGRRSGEQHFLADVFFFPPMPKQPHHDEL